LCCYHRPVGSNAIGSSAVDSHRTPPPAHIVARGNFTKHYPLTSTFLECQLLPQLIVLTRQRLQAVNPLSEDGDLRLQFSIPVEGLTDSTHRAEQITNPGNSAAGGHMKRSHQFGQEGLGLLRSGGGQIDEYDGNPGNYNQENRHASQHVLQTGPASFKNGTSLTAG
jgi:hypothetical protein